MIVITSGRKGRTSWQLDLTMATLKRKKSFHDIFDPIQLKVHTLSKY